MGRHKWSLKFVMLFIVMCMKVNYQNSSYIFKIKKVLNY